MRPENARIPSLANLQHPWPTCRILLPVGTRQAAPPQDERMVLLWAILIQSYLICSSWQYIDERSFSFTHPTRQNTVTVIPRLLRMPIDFHLSSTESATRASAAAFAQNVLKAARSEYLKQQGQHNRFQTQKPIYEATVKNGLVKSQISPPLGGDGGSLTEAVIMVEVRGFED